MKIQDLLKSKAQIEAEIEAIRKKERQEAREKEAEKQALIAKAEERKQSEFLYFQVVSSSLPFEVIVEELLKDTKFLPFLLGATLYANEQRFDSNHLRNLLQRVIPIYKEKINNL